MILFRDWSKQPPFGTRFRTGHWSTRGLVSAWLMHPQHHMRYDSLNGTTPQLSVDLRKSTRVATHQNGFVCTRTTTPLGMTDSWNSATAWAITDAAQLPLNPNNPFTIVAWHRSRTVTPNNVKCLVGFGNSGTNTPYLQLMQTTSTMGHGSFQMRDDANNLMNINVTKVLEPTRFYCLGARSNGSNSHSLRIDGVNYTSTTSLGTKTFDRFAIGGLLRATLANQCEGEFFGPLLYDRFLNDAEIDALAANPWIVFQPRGIYFTTPTAGGGDVSLAGAAAAAASGAGALTQAQQLAVAAVSSALAAGTLSTSAPLTGAAIAAALGAAALEVFTNVWRFPTNAPNGSVRHVIILDGTAPNYTVLVQAQGTVAGGVLDIPAPTGSPGTKRGAVFGNYNDNPAVASIIGGWAVATVTSI